MRNLTTLKTTCLALTLGASLIAEVQADRLVIKGSDTLGAKLVPQLAEEFKAQSPAATFDIAAEGSTTGIAAIIDGTAQIGMSSHEDKLERARAVRDAIKAKIEAWCAEACLRAP